jgi:hypothetical protein
VGLREARELGDLEPLALKASQVEIRGGVERLV